MLVAAAAGVVITIGEFFANLLNAGPSGFGVLVAAVGLGMVAGLLAASPLSRRLRPEWLFGPGLIVAGIGLVLTAFAAELAVAIYPAALMGSGAGSSSSSATRSCSSARTTASAAARSPRSTRGSGRRSSSRRSSSRSPSASSAASDAPSSSSMASPSSSTPTCSVASATRCSLPAS
jgi:MFS family permease